MSAARLSQIPVLRWVIDSGSIATRERLFLSDMYEIAQLEVPLISDFSESFCVSVRGRVTLLILEAN
jgi:hypothetical protein